MTDQKQALDRLIEAVEAGEAQEWQFLSLHTIQQADDAHRAYHGSLDAAKALHEALLPGWLSDVWTDGAAFVWLPAWDGPDVNCEIPGEPARALLLADLRAYRGTLA